MAMQQMPKHASRDPEMYYIEVDVVNAVDLASKDLGGKSDPFVKVLCNGEERQTKVVKKNLSPQWNAKFQFKFFELKSRVIQFEVLDKDLTSNDKIGSASFDLEAMLGANGKNGKAKPVTPFTGSLTLKHKKKARGTLNVRICAQRLLPLNAQKLNEKNREVMVQQSQQIDSLSLQIGTLRQQNATLQRQVAIEGDNGKIGTVRPTRRQEAIEGANRLVEMAMAKVIVLRLLGQKIMAIWQFVLRMCVYQLPVVGHYIDLVVLLLGSVLRLGLGHDVLDGAATSKRPNKVLKLYEFEGDMDCKLVRETLSALDLDCVVYPCPPGKDEYLSRFMGDAKKLCGGKMKLPLLVDENFEDGPLVCPGSDMVVKYLMDQYGNNVKMSKVDKIRHTVARHWMMVTVYKLYQCALRCLPEQGNERKGTTVKPKELLELWSFEASPFCSKVKEVMSALELPYLVKNVAMGSKQKRQEFQIRFGKKYPQWRQKLNMIQVPMLIDPNTGREVFESEDIKKYLVQTYCTTA